MITGNSIIRIRRGATGGVIPVGLTYGELAVNITDRKLYVGNETGASVEIIGSGVGTGGGAETTWSNPAPTTTTDLEGVPVGSTFEFGTTAIEILEQILYAPAAPPPPPPYTSVSFSNFSSGLASTYELGETAGNGSLSVSWTASQPHDNWVPASAYISYSGLSNGQALTGASPTAGSAVAVYPAFRSTSLSSNTVTITLTGQQDQGSNPSTSTTSRWWTKAYWGKSTNASLTDPLALSNGSDVVVTSGTTITASTTDAGGYFYFFINNYYSVSSMTLAGFPVALNGVSTASVVNSQGFTSTYKIYRSFYELPGPLDIVVVYA